MSLIEGNYHSKQVKMSEQANDTLSAFKEKVKETLTLFHELPEEQKQEALLFWSNMVSQVENGLTDQGEIKTEVPLAETDKVREKPKVKRRRGWKGYKQKTVNNQADSSIPSVAEAEAVSGLLEIQNKSDSQILNGQEIIREENVQIIHLNSDGKANEVIITPATEGLNASSNQLEEFSVVATPEPVYIYPGLSPLKYDTPLTSYGSEDVLHIQIEKTDGKVQNYVVKPIKKAGKGKPLELIEEHLETAEEDNESHEVENGDDSEVDSENEENSSHQTRRQKQKNSEKYLKCKKCSKLLSSTSALNIHLRSHSGDRPFACNVCYKTFSTKGNMQRHERSHEGQKPFKCKECDSRFTEKKSLKVHMRRHTGERPFKCPHCPKSFMQSGTLQSHLLVHTGQKSHLCDTCGQAFRQKSQLKVHQKRHEGIREFECDICPYKSISKGDLDRHKLRHTGEKPYLCELCPKRFTRQQYLKEHMNVHNGTNPYKCDKCEFATSKMAVLYRHKRRHKADEEKKAKQRTGPFRRPNRIHYNVQADPEDIYEQDASQLENSVDPVVVDGTDTHVVQEQVTENTSYVHGVKLVQITFMEQEQGEVVEDDGGSAPAETQFTQELPAQEGDVPAVKLQANATTREYFIENS